MNWIVSIVLDDVERADMIQILRVHSSCHKDRQGLKEYFVFYLPEIDERNLNLTNQGRVLKFEEHRELKMLCASFLLNVYFVFVDAWMKLHIQSKIV